jgi:hypothetical protein
MDKHTKRPSLTPSHFLLKISLKKVIEKVIKYYKTIGYALNKTKLKKKEKDISHTSSVALDIKIYKENIRIDSIKDWEGQTISLTDQIENYVYKEIINEEDKETIKEGKEIYDDVDIDGQTHSLTDTNHFLYVKSIYDITYDEIHMHTYSTSGINRNGNKIVGIVLRKWTGERNQIAISRENLHKGMEKFYRKLRQNDKTSIVEYAIEQHRDKGLYHIHMIVHFDNYQNVVDVLLQTIKFMDNGRYVQEIKKGKKYTTIYGNYGTGKIHNIYNYDGYRNYIDKQKEGVRVLYKAKK